MRNTRHVMVIGGAALLLAGVLLGALAFNPMRPASDVIATGDSTPTQDPCQEPDRVASYNGQDQIAMFAVGEPCETPTEETLPRTHTPTPEPTDEPELEEPTDEPATNTAVPATNTPTGGAGAGGLRPPNTGSGGDTRSAATQWLLVGGALFALAAGAGTVVYGATRRS